MSITGITTDNPKIANKPELRKVNYKGLELTIEYEAGTWRPDSDSSIPFMGWYMEKPYGYIDGTASPEEGEEMDCYLGSFDNDQAYLIELLDVEGVFVEYKVMIGFKNPLDARQFAIFQYGPNKVGNTLQMSITDLITMKQQGELAAQRIKELVQKEGEPGMPGKEGVARGIDDDDEDDGGEVEELYQLIDPADFNPDPDAYD